MIQKPIQYEKHQSFQGFLAKSSNEDIEQQRIRALSVLENIANDNNFSKHRISVLERARKDLTKKDSDKNGFKITSFIADEIALLDDIDLPKYFYHRYRYDIFPKTRELDAYPPYIQIEPTSICNFRCVFCYQTDKEFSDKRSSYMGSMQLETFKSIVDQIEGNIEILSLSSRGEPTANKYLPEMLDYSKGKFLNLKINTNASLLTDKIIHALLSGAVGTLVFSADAAEEPVYSQLRVNGSLKRVLENIEKFQKIRERDYPDVKMLTRVSGVMVDKEKQKMESMRSFWSGLVDQITFVNYNPWENIYQSPVNDIVQPCSDLWRRMFIWYDGKANPCDTDYKSSLSVGNIDNNTVAELWRSKKYSQTREDHLNNMRKNTEPCRRCSLV